MHEQRGAARPLPGQEWSADHVHILREAFALDAARAAARLDAAALVASMRPAGPGSPHVSMGQGELFAPTRLTRMTAPLWRTRDSVPIILGSVLGGLMLVVFTVAAVFMRLVR